MLMEGEEGKKKKKIHVEGEELHNENSEATPFVSYLWIVL